MGIPFSTSSGTVKVVERFGKFNHIQDAGCSCLWCPFIMDNISGLLSMRLQQLDVVCDTKSTFLQLTSFCIHRLPSMRAHFVYILYHHARSFLSFNSFICFRFSDSTGKDNVFVKIEVACQFASDYNTACPESCSGWFIDPFSPFVVSIRR